MSPVSRGGRRGSRARSTGRGESPDVFISTGEASGDLIGAALAGELRRRSHGIRIYGFGGPRMSEAGVETDRSLFSGAIVGWTGVFRHLSMFLSLLSELRRRWARRPPSAVVLVDYPGFNLRLGAIAHGLGIPVYYYVCPQVWAWAPGRLMTMRRILTRAFLILPFEEPLFRSFGIPSTFVGHPMIEAGSGDGARRAAVMRRAGLDLRRRTVVMLPGSRADEIRRHLPVFLASVRALARGRKDLQWVVIAAPGREGSVAAEVARSGRLSGGAPPVRVFADRDRTIRATADVAWTASGTATLEMGLLGIPQLVVYRGNWTNAIIARWLVRVPYVSLVNLILGRRAVPELLQGGFTIEVLVAATRRLLSDRNAADRARADARELSRMLKTGDVSPSARVAASIMADLDRNVRE